MKGFLCTPFLTDSIATLELQNPSHDYTELHKIRRFPGFEATKMKKKPVG